MRGDIVLGAGVTGLTIGIVSGLPVYEAQPTPGGLCMSYYVDGFRFEVGGGHWIFGRGAGLAFLREYAEMRRYQRRAGVYFPDQGIIVPYPVQAHKDELPILSVKDYNCPSDGMGVWMLDRFGADLCGAFFFPFHEKYTAGLWRHIAPQDAYKFPVSGSGYNAEFAYPVDGLDAMVRAMAQDCDVRYDKGAIFVDVANKRVLFLDGSIVEYDNIYSTIPLNQMMDMTGLHVGVGKDPHTPVSVLNVGGIKGPKCPDEQWLYVAQEDVPFHRIGIYSNVDASFVPWKDCVSFCVESVWGFLIEYDVIGLLQRWGFMEDVITVSSTYIDVAYTWRWCRSSWRQKSLDLLESYGIHQIGRFGRWKFQGIVASVEDGLRYDVVA